jgi:hypothetical protein
MIEGQVQRRVMVPVIETVAVKQFTPSLTIRQKPAWLMKTARQSPNCRMVTAYSRDITKI